MGLIHVSASKINKEKNNKKGDNISKVFGKHSRNVSFYFSYVVILDAYSHTLTLFFSPIDTAEAQVFVNVSF